MSNNNNNNILLQNNNEIGISVTARNLTLTGSESFEILKDLNFYLKPGTLTLILGTPSCGKSSLLKVLANQLHGEIKTGSLLFNNNELNPINHHKNVSYVTQEDTHMPSLTVRETIKFSADCLMDKNSTEETRNERVDKILNLLGLESHQSTLVGDNFIRGVSGGQKKRVTIGIEMVKDSKLFLMDEISNGLDSTTTIDLIQKFKATAKNENATFLISLLQPGVDVTNLFDNLLMLSQGKMVYFGPIGGGISYFEEFGFRLPLNHNPSEFFQEIIEEPELYCQGTPPLKETEEFSNAYFKSSIYQNVINEIESMNQNSSLNVTNNIDETCYSTSIIRQTELTSKRAIRMLISNPMVIYIRVIKSVIVGLMLGSLFFGLSNNQEDGNNRFKLLFYSLLFIVFGGMQSTSIIFAERQVYYNQKDAKYYHPFSYFMSLSIIEVPLSFLEAILFSTLIYWMCGLNGNGWKFVYFFLMIFISNVFSNSFFKMVSSFSPTQSIATIIAPMLIAPFILFCGFLMKKPSIPGWWIWMYWISPTKYALEGIMSNEYHKSEYTCDAYEMVPYLNDPLLNETYPVGYNGIQICPFTKGDQYLNDFGMPQNGWYKWIDLLIMFAFTMVIWVMLYYFLSVVYYDSRLMKKNSIEKRKNKLSSNNCIDLPNNEHQVVISGKDMKEMVDINQESNKFKCRNGCFMQWKNLDYSVEVKSSIDGKGKEGKKLLCGINGYVKPGMLLALMGPSGAGKSTLLDVLANRKTGGFIDGEILVDQKKRSKNYTRISAYVEQFDILPPTQTVREAFLFSANLRLPNTMQQEEREKLVEEVLDTLNLGKVANKVIGSTLSLSQRKRVSIGIELSANPRLLFLDEPTSGLDSSSALKVMNFIKKIASTGRSVICTIHQPSTSIFKQFDHLLLLKKGGETVYFGPTGESSTTVLNYFAQHNLFCEPLSNPADFILDNVENDSFDAASSFKNSHLYQTMIDNLENNNQTLDDGICSEASETEENNLKLNKSFSSKYSSSIKVQFNNLLIRLWKSQIRRPINLMVRLVMSLMLGVVLGTFFVRMDHSQKNVFNRTSLLFFGLIFSGMSGMSFIPVITTERGVFYREQSSGMYRVWIYVATFLLTDLPWVFASSILFSIPAYFISGLYLGPSGSHFFYYTFIVFTTFLNYQLLAILLAFALPTDEIANAFAGICLALSALFAGFMKPLGGMTKIWKWFTYLDFVRYPLEIVMVNEFEPLKEFTCLKNKNAIPVPISVFNNQTQQSSIETKYYCPIQNGQQILDQFSMDVNNYYKNIPIIFTFTIVFILFIFITLKFIKYQNK